jgi:TRAP-type C4-dicarboxylate transport system permease small subunit
MLRKILKILLDIIVSFIVFLILAMLIDWIASKIFGTTTNADGVTHVNLNGGILLAITTILTIAFAIWFYKLLTNYKINKVKE